MDSAVWEDETLFKLWGLCCFLAVHKETQVIPTGCLKPITLERGQFLTTRKDLHAEYYRKRSGKRKSECRRKSPSTLWRHLKTLHELGNLNLFLTPKYTLVTICNYDIYNSPCAKLEPNSSQTRAALSNTNKQTSKGLYGEPDEKLLPEGLAEPAADLAQRWCFVCTRRTRFGQVADTVAQIQPQFAELLRLGYSHADLLRELDSPTRDRNEQFFHFADRIKQHRPQPPVEPLRIKLRRQTLTTDYHNGNMSWEQYQAQLKTLGDINGHS